MQPGSTLYQRVIVRNHQAESGTNIELTKEVNCLLLWRHTWTVDTDELVIVKHFPSHQANAAIEFSVDYGRKLKEQIAPSPAPAPEPYRCKNCGEISDTGLDCCDDEFPERGDIEETGR